MTDYPQGWTAADLMAVEFPPTRWAVPGLLVEGLTLLVGPPKSGKSWLALNIATAVACGGHALGNIPVDKGDTCVLALEDPGRRLKERVGIMLEGDVPPTAMHLFPTWPLLHDGGLELLDCWLTEHPDCRLVVLDVLAKVRGTTDYREDKYAADYRQIVGLKDLADRHRVALLVVHHTRKQASEDDVDLVSGTHGLAGAADSILVLKRSRGSADAKLSVTGRDVEEHEHALKMNGGRWLLLDGPASDYDVSEERRRILNVVRARPGLTPKAIATMSGLKYDSVRQLVLKMVDSGDLDNDGKGHYSPSLPSLRSLSEDVTSERSEQSEGLVHPLRVVTDDDPDAA